MLADPAIGHAMAWFFGCWDQPGHYLHGRDGAAPSTKPHALVQMHHRLDGCYAPRKMLSGVLSGQIVFTAQCGGFRDAAQFLETRSGELDQGHYLRHRFEGTDVSLISWWDRTQGDTRHGCNSAFVVVGDHTAEALVDAFPRVYPSRAARLERAGVRLVEVKPTPTSVWGAHCPSCAKLLYETRHPRGGTVPVPAEHMAICAGAYPKSGDAQWVYMRTE